MIGDVKMQTIKRRTGRSLTGDRPLFLALVLVIHGFEGSPFEFLNFKSERGIIYPKFHEIKHVIPG